MENDELDLVIALLKNEKKDNDTKKGIIIDSFNKNNSKTQQNNNILPLLPLIPNINNNQFNSKIPKLNKNEKAPNISKPQISFKKFKDLPGLGSARQENMHQNHFIIPSNIFKNLNNTNSNLNFSLQNTQTPQRNIRTSPSPQPINLKIRYLNFRPYVDIQRIVNEENTKNSEISNDKLKLTAPKYYFKMLGNECPLVKNLLEDNGFVQCSFSSNEFSILWSSGHIKLSIYSDLTKWQRLNHFPRSNELTRKDLLYKNVSKLVCSFPSNKFNFIPTSFILPNEHKFLEDEMAKDEKALWIVKPVAMSQGRGIFLTNKIGDIPSGYNMIACKYISNPYLINNKKFDLRVYVFVSSIKPLRIYRYREGLVRFASDNYSSDINDRCSHLTNYAVNKNNKNYIKNNDPEETDFSTSKWNFSGLKQYFEQKGINYNAIFDKIDDIIIKTFISCEHSLLNALEKNCSNNNNCFELFGFDILLDSNLTPWLIEVNLSPNLHYDAPIDLKIKGEMIAEIFDIIRIVPYDLRTDNFGEGFYIGNCIKNIKELKKIKINRETREMIWDTNEEYKRIEMFKRIFPTNRYFEYRKLFDKEREINLILGMIEFEKSKTLK